MTIQELKGKRRVQGEELKKRTNKILLDKVRLNIKMYWTNSSNASYHYCNAHHYLECAYLNEEEKQRWVDYIYSQTKGLTH
jgi:hypothetical protein